MLIHSQQLGEVEVPEESVVSFPEGLLGFRDERRFCLISVRAGSRFSLLQSADRPDLAFVVTDPVELDKDYPIEGARQHALRVGVEEQEPLAVAVIVTVGVAGSKPTANMLAPLVIGTDSRVGVQVVMHDTDYLVRHEL